MERGRWHAPVGGGGVEGRGVQDSWPQNGLLHRRGNSAVGGGPVDGREGGGSSSLIHAVGGAWAASAAAVVGAGIAAMATAVGAAALRVAICSFASFRSFFRIRIWSCMELTNRYILESVCSSRIFSIRRAAATTSSIIQVTQFLHLHC